MTDANLPSTDTIQELVGEINARLKKPAATTGDDDLLGDISGFIPTGITALDCLIGGGWPLGRFSEIYSKWAVGKSTIAMIALRNCQRMGGIAVLIDSEGAFYKPYAQDLGLDVTRLIVLEIKDIETGFERIHRFLTNVREKEDMKDRPVMIVWDTISFTPSEAESSKFRNERMMGRYIMLKSELRKIRKTLSEKKACLLFVNHEIAAPKGDVTDVGWQEDSGEGFAIKYMSSIRIWLKGGEPLPQRDGVHVGHMMWVGIKKSRVGLPGHLFPVPFYSGSGPDDYATTFEFLKHYKLFEQAGSWWKQTIGETEYKFQNYEGFLKCAQESEFREYLMEAMRGLSTIKKVEVHEQSFSS